jgi:hypothetical protein
LVFGTLMGGLGSGNVNADSLTIDSITPNRGLTIGGDILTITGSGFLSNVTNFDYTGDVQTFTAPTDGTYRFEAWGGQGGSSGSAVGGMGGYSSGEISLTTGDVVYVYVGQAGNIDKSATDYSVPGTFNGGGGGSIDVGDQYGSGAGGAGGGATDFRLLSGDWNDEDSLRSRIMVAGGGGGGEDGQNNGIVRLGGNAGGLTGNAGENGGGGATQVTGGTANGSGATAGQFGSGGKGGYRYNSSRFFGAGGGGGFYGGGGGGQQTSNRKAGGGGSSYISGFTGSVAVTSASDSTPKAGCTTGTTDNSCSVHYSGWVFDDTSMLAGGDIIARPNGRQATGNSGNGYARISFVVSPNSISLGGEDCPIIRISDTAILCTIPAHAAGTVNVVINVANENHVLPAAYTYANPTVTAISPASGSIDGGETVTISGTNLDLLYNPVAEFAYTGTPQSFIAPKADWYQLKLWGAQGGCKDNASGCQTRVGRGGYSSGEVLLKAGEEVLVYVGQAGGNGQTLYNGWNAYEVNTDQGKVTSGASTDWNNGYGGGATDIRVGGNTAWHRFIVAGGGGGSLNDQCNAGYGGGLTGENGGNGSSGGTQTGSGNGGFGWGGWVSGARSSGGGGWYGGTGGGYCSGGGSGFILTEATQVPTGYQVGSDYFLNNASTLGGRSVSFPAVDGSTETGHSGNGFARIETLTAPLAVNLGGSPCEITAVSDIAITCTTSAHSAEVVDVAVSATGMAFELVDGYEYTDQLPFIELGVAGSLDMGGSPGQLIADHITANVKTDNPDGYSLSVSAEDVDLICVSDNSKKITALSGTKTTNEMLNQWGYAVDPNPLSPTLPTSWTGITSSGTAITTTSTPQTDPSIGEDTLVWFGAKVDWSLPACKYGGTLTFTVVGN